MSNPISEPQRAKRRVNAAIELVIENIGLTEEEATVLVMDAIEWLKANKYEEAILMYSSVEIAMRAGYLYGFSKRLEN